MPCLPVLIALVLATGTAELASAGDWPQILGPNRDGRAVDETVSPWIKTPTIRWRVKCGAGYSGVAIAKDRVFLWHREDDSELLDCLSTADGHRLWRAEFPAIYQGGVNPDRGPRAVPLVTDDQVFVYGAAGDLHAVSVSDGKTLWSRQLRTEYDAEEGYFGAAGSPLLVGQLLIVPVGGEQNAGLVAIDIRDGKSRWTAVDQEAAYASPVTIEIDGQTRVVAVLRLKTVMLDPATGKVLSEFAFGKRGPTVNAATPLVDQEKLFVTAAYGVGCRMLDLSVQPPKDLWSSREVIASHYVTPVHINEFLYAITGREDYGTGELMCVRWSDGEVTWKVPDFGTAHLIGVGTRVLAQRVSGRLVLFSAVSSEFRSLAEAELPAGIYRSLPAFAGGTVYCRRTLSATQGEVLAIELKSESVTIQPVQ